MFCKVCWVCTFVLQCLRRSYSTHHLWQTLIKFKWLFFYFIQQSLGLLGMLPLQLLLLLLVFLSFNNIQIIFLFTDISRRQLIDYIHHQFHQVHINLHHFISTHTHIGSTPPILYFIKKEKNNCFHLYFALTGIGCLA